MGKKLIIKGADFYANALDSEEAVIISNGLISWLDAKTLGVGDQYWNASTKLQSIYKGFNIKIPSSDNTIVARTALSVTGSNGGASMLVSSSGTSCNNPFWSAGMAANDNMTMELVFKTSRAAGSTTILFGGTYYGNDSYGLWRYQVQMNTSGHPRIIAHDGSDWNEIFLSEKTINDGDIHIISYQKEGTTFRLYIDGELDLEEQNVSVQLPIAKTNNNNISIGRYAGVQDTVTNATVGDYYSFAMYNRALSALEIANNYQIYLDRYDV